MRDLNTRSPQLLFEEGVPLYVQVAEHLLHRWQALETSSRTAPTNVLPTERELMQQYAVSRTTIRAALKELEGREVLVRQRGRSAILTSPERLYPLHGIQEELALRQPGVTPDFECLQPWNVKGHSAFPGRSGFDWHWCWRAGLEVVGTETISTPALPPITATTPPQEVRKWIDIEQRGAEQSLKATLERLREGEDDQILMRLDRTVYDGRGNVIAVIRLAFKSRSFSIIMETRNPT